MPQHQENNEKEHSQYEKQGIKETIKQTYLLENVRSSVPKC